ncbi:MAG: 50S ribosomal protein L19 [Chloroflexi bacterium]|nr:50S ribosomal protein L19 [Chloroflexota bacterium]
MAQARDLVPLQLKDSIQDFRPGDTVRVSFRVKEGERERVQTFQGLVLRKHKGGPGTTFTVRRVASGVGVERIFPLYSPLIESISILRHGDVRRSRLYYQRQRFGRAARIKERSVAQAPAKEPEQPPTPQGEPPAAAAAPQEEVAPAPQT